MWARHTHWVMGKLPTTVQEERDRTSRCPSVANSFSADVAVSFIGILPHSHFEFCFIIVKYLHNSNPQPTCVRERKTLQPFTDSVKNRHMYTYSPYLRRKLRLLFVSYIFILLEKCSRTFMVAHGILSFKIYFPSFLPSFLFFFPSSHPSVCAHAVL